MTEGGGLDYIGDKNDERIFDLRLFIRYLWRWKLLIIISAIVGGAFGVKRASEFVPTYEAMMIVQPVDQLGSSSIPQISGMAMGVARSIGLRPGSSANPSLDLFKVMIGSRVLAKRIQDKYGLMQIVYKGGWDFEAKAWIKPEIDDDSIKQRLRRFFRLNSWHPPDIGTLATFLNSAVRVGQFRDTGFFKLSVEHPDREFALYLLDVVYREADSLIGSTRRQEQLERRNYLKVQIETARLTEVRDALLSLLMQQEQRAIIADDKPPYTVKVIEPLNASAHAKEPLVYRTILMPAGIMTAVAICAIIVFVSFRHE